MNNTIILTGWAIIVFFMVLIICAAIEGWLDDEE